MPQTLFGAGFTLATAYALGNLLLRERRTPFEIRLALGAAAESSLVFLLLLCHLANWEAFLALGIVSVAAAWRFRSAASAPADAIRIPRPAWIVFAAYGVWYLVNALAPETQADGYAYHLGLPVEYLRIGGFPDRTAFYGLIPQGMEMLYTVAFAFRRHAAAKLVEFAFFLATVPLFFRIARRLSVVMKQPCPPLQAYSGAEIGSELRPGYPLGRSGRLRMEWLFQDSRPGASDLAALVAAVFYFCAPVVGLTGSSSYNDAAGVFFLLAAFYLLLNPVAEPGSDPTLPDSAGEGETSGSACPTHAESFASKGGADASACEPHAKTIASRLLSFATLMKPRSRDRVETSAFVISERPLSGTSVPVLLAAGVLAGFCYCIKYPGAMAPIGAVLFAAWQRRWRAALLVAAGATLVMTPWIARDLILTGNPVAPLMNRVFPNSYTHIATEQEIVSTIRSLGEVKPAQIPWELAFGDRLAGTFGPLLLALPLGLLALRWRTGRLLWAGALLMALPWITNHGARFLLSGVALAALALGIVLPRPAAWAAIAIQALLCWPQVIDIWETRYAFRLHEFPIAAALGIESEAAYCKPRFEEYSVAKMIERATPPESRTLALASVAGAYLDRDVSVTWQSAESDRLLDTLRLASVYTGTPTFDWRTTWPEQPVRTLRFRMPASYQGEWDIDEVRLFSGDYPIFNSPQWTLSGWPNPWEAPLAFDGNPATRWRTWENVQAGMYMDIDMGHPQRLSAAVLNTHTPALGVTLEIYGRDGAGKWHLLCNTPQAIPRPPQDLRLDAARAVRNAGFRYVLLPTGADGNAPVGNVIVGHETEWGMERVGEAGRFYLERVK